MFRSNSKKLLLVHSYYGGLAPSGEDITVLKELSLLEGLVGVDNLLHLDANFEKGNLRLLNIFRFCVMVFWSNIRLLYFVISFRPDTIIVHNAFPFFSLVLINFLARRFETVVYMHNHRLYCANALLLRENKYCDLCLEKNFSFHGIRNKCKGNSTSKSFIYSVYGYIIRAVGLNNIAKFVTFSDRHKKLVLRSNIALDERVIVLPHFVTVEDREFEKIINNVSTPQQLKEKFVFVGRLSAEKGVEQLLQAVSENPNISIEVIGDGPQKCLLEAEYANFDRIIFNGKLSQESLFKKLVSCDYLLMNSICFETFGLVVAEAFAHGIPVIARNFGTPADFVRHGENGFLFDDDTLAETLRFASNASEAIYSKLKDGALETYTERFSVEVRKAAISNCVYKSHETKKELSR